MAEETNQEQNEQQNGEQQQQEQQGGILESVVGAVGAVVSAVVETASSVAEGAAGVVSSAASAVGLTGEKNETPKGKRGNRAQKIGVVTSDKMTKTVVVSVNRQVLHPKYRRYIRRTTKFMAHDEMNAAIGDKVRIVETRPLSARKRWRVVEIVQKAAK